MAALLRVVLSLGLELVAPSRCAACDEPVRMRTVFCRPCAASVVASEDRGLGFASPFVYGGSLARAISRMKYEGRHDLARPLADLLRRGLSAARAHEADLVVPVPLHPRRLAERGYNQSALLARPVARELRVPFAPRALARVRDTPRQALLDRAHRLENVTSAFACKDERVSGRHVLLVDDVRTTGATLAACDAALRRAGARAVTPLVLAHAPSGAWGP